MSKTCPMCKFKIPNDAVVCGHCGSTMRTTFDLSFLSRLNAAVVGSLKGAAIGFVLSCMLLISDWLPAQNWFSVIALAITFFTPLIYLMRDGWICGHTTELWTKK